MADDANEAIVSCRLAYVVDEPATIVLNVAASTTGQTVLEETWQLDRDDAEIVELATDGDARLHRLVLGPGPVSVRYEARVALHPVTRVTGPLLPPPAAELGEDLLRLLRPSRFAQSDRVIGMGTREFGALAPGADQVAAIVDWVHDKVDYVSGSTDAEDSALETILTRRGVCRDFAHLTIAFARALAVPARYASVYAPLLDPPDFHAIAEVWLDDRWWLVDATRLAPRTSLVRIGTGRDAADCAFATIVGGQVRGQAVEVAARTVGDPPQDDHRGLVRHDLPA